MLQAYDGYLDLQQGSMLGVETPICFEAVDDEIRALRAQMAQQAPPSSYGTPATPTALTYGRAT